VIAAVPGGPVILDGNDPGDHVSANMTSYMQGVYHNLDINIAPGYVHNGKTAVIGPCASVLSAIAPPGETFDSFTTVAAVRAFFNNIGSNNYKIIHICDNQEGNVAINLPAAVESELSQWGFALTTHVNRGGGLVSNGNNYAWLIDLFPSLVITPGGTGQSYVTPDGQAFFQLPTNQTLPAINHYTFTNVPNPPLKTLLTELTNNGGKLVAIGGIVVRFPQIFITGPTVADVGSAQTFTLTAATADGVLLPNNAYSYTISGVTGSAGSGTGVTDANGQATFNVSGNARGTTTIRVRLGISANTAGGAQVVTNWVSLASAPTLTSAVDTPAGGGASADLTWTAPTTAGLTAVTDYQIEQSVDGVTWAIVSHPASTATSYTVTSLNPAGTYYFRVSAVNSDGPGAVSNVLMNPVPVAQTITFPQPGTATVGVPVTLTASSTSALAITYVGNSPAVCTVSGTSATFIGVGTCSITANQAGNRSFTAATPVTQTFSVGPGAQTSSGAFAATQSVVVPPPAGGSVTLLDAASVPATTVTNTSGSYTIDTTIGTITFTPASGFVGIAAPVTFQTTDAAAVLATNTYTPTVSPPGVVVPPARTSTGAYGTTQSVVVPPPASGSVTLLDGTLAPATTVTNASGSYTIDTTTGTITFTPANGFVGVATAVTFQTTDQYSQSASNTYTPTVTGPVVAARTGSGAFNTVQTTTVPIPPSGSVTLLDSALAAATTVTNADGSYTIDVTTGIISFTPVSGFVGVAASVTFRTTDQYAQNASNTYTPTVNPPAQPPVPSATTNGSPGVTQSTVVTIPVGSTLTLLDASATPVTMLTVIGQGTFALDTLTGTITFVPELGFIGSGTVSFRMTDQYSQSTTATYTANVVIIVVVVPPTPVTPPVDPPGPTTPPVNVNGQAVAPTMTVLDTASSSIPVKCVLKGATLSQCTVTLWATVSGRQVAIGTATASSTDPKATSIVVNVTLTPLGRALAAQPGGLQAVAAAAITPRGSTKIVHVSDTTKIVAHTFVLPRPVFFDTGSAALRPAEARYLDALRRELAGVRSISCVGYTDSVDTSARNLALGRARAATVCAYLVRGTNVRILNASMGESAPQATNKTAAGRQRNRRTTIRFTY
jgi:CshA-type fibril repeat protein